MRSRVSFVNTSLTREECQRAGSDFPLVDNSLCVAGFVVLELVQRAFY